MHTIKYNRKNIVTNLTITLTKPVTFAEYLSFQATQDITYELHRGELVPVATGRAQHGKIARFLENTFRGEITPFPSKDYATNEKIKLSVFCTCSAERN